MGRCQRRPRGGWESIHRNVAPGANSLAGVAPGARVGRLEASRCAPRCVRRKRRAPDDREPSVRSSRCNRNDQVRAFRKEEPAGTCT